MLTLPGFTLLYCCQYYMKFSVNFLWMPFRANNLQNLKGTQTHFNQYICFCMNMMNGCKWTEPWNFLATQHTQHAYILAVKRQGILQFNNCKNFSRSEEYIPYKHIHTRLLRNIKALNSLNTLWITAYILSSVGLISLNANLIVNVGELNLWASRVAYWQKPWK